MGIVAYMGALRACVPDVHPVAGRPRLPVPVRRGKPSLVSIAVVRDNGQEWAVVQQAIAGDAAAQEHLFTRHRRRLYRTAFAMLRNQQDAEDALQESLCKAYASLRSFQGRSSFYTWLTRIVVNTALMARRSKGIHSETSLDQILENQPKWLPREVVDKRPDPEELCATIEIRAFVEKYIRQLPPALQGAFRLCAINGLSGTEASQRLGISVSAVRSRIFRAHRKLTRLLRRSPEISGDVLAFGKPAQAGLFWENRTTEADT